MSVVTEQEIGVTQGNPVAAWSDGSKATVASVVKGADRRLSIYVTTFDGKSFAEGTRRDVAAQNVALAPVNGRLFAFALDLTARTTDGDNKALKAIDLGPVAVREGAVQIVQGPPGPAGSRGEQGPQGPAGPPGPAGANMDERLGQYNVGAGETVRGQLDAIEAQVAGSRRDADYLAEQQRQIAATLTAIQQATEAQQAILTHVGECLTHLGEVLAALAEEDEAPAAPALDVDALAEALLAALARRFPPASNTDTEPKVVPL